MRQQAGPRRVLFCVTKCFGGRLKAAFSASRVTLFRVVYAPLKQEKRWRIRDKTESIQRKISRAAHAAPLSNMGAPA